MDTATENKDFTTLLVENFVNEDRQMRAILMFLESLKLSYEGGIELVMSEEINKAYYEFVNKITDAVVFTISERYKKKNLNEN